MSKIYDATILYNHLGAVLKIVREAHPNGSVTFTPEREAKLFDDACDLMIKCHPDSPLEGLVIPPSNKIVVI